MRLRFYVSVVFQSSSSPCGFFFPMSGGGEHAVRGCMWIHKCKLLEKLFNLLLQWSDKEQHKLVFYVISTQQQCCDDACVRYWLMAESDIRRLRYLLIPDFKVPVHFTAFFKLQHILSADFLSLTYSHLLYYIKFEQRTFHNKTSPVEQGHCVPDKSTLRSICFALLQFFKIRLDASGVFWHRLPNAAWFHMKYYINLLSSCRLVDQPCIFGLTSIFGDNWLLQWKQLINALVLWCLWYILSTVMYFLRSLELQ